MIVNPAGGNRLHRWISSCYLAGLCLCIALYSSPVLAQVAVDTDSYRATYSAMNTDRLVSTALRGDRLAQHELSSRFAGGSGVPTNQAAAAYWYSLAASRGLPGTQSLDRLPNVPILAKRHLGGDMSNPPMARFSVVYDVTSLVATIDGSASTSTDGIDRYIWSLSTVDGSPVELNIGNVQSVQLSFAEPGTYFVTLAILDVAGRIAHVTNRLVIEAPPTQEKPDVPVPIAPSAGADIIVNQTETFTWVRDPQASSYDFHFFNNQPGDDRGALPFILDLYAQDICDAQICEFSTTVNLPIYTQHAWRVRAGNAAGKSNWSRRTFNGVELVTEVPAVPVPESPLSSARLEAGTTVSFSWSAMPEASRYEFRLSSDILPAWEGAVALVPASSCTDSRCSISIELSLPTGASYPLTTQWQVRAENAAGSSEWVEVDFTIIAVATEKPPTPIAVAPTVNALISQADTIDFSWLRDDHAASYEFHFFDAVNSITRPFTVGLNPADLCGESICTLALAVDLPVGPQHAWRVRGRNSKGASDWSRSTIEVIETVTAPPGGFELSYPAAGAEIVTGSAVTFQWSRAAQATGFDFALIDGSIPNAEPDVIAINASTCGADFCSFDTVLSLPLSDQHLWQVRAVNTLGAGPWQSAAFAMIAEPVVLPAAPVVVAPLAGTSVHVNQTVEFQWEHDQQALSYDFYINDAENGALPLSEGLPADDLCSNGLCAHSVFIELPISGLHSWHVRSNHSEVESEWSSTQLTVLADPADPVASFKVAGFEGDVIGIAPLSLSFDPGESVESAQIISYAWNFGDGSDALNVSSADVIVHDYLLPGTYTVLLTVTNNAGRVDSASVNITVLDPATTMPAVDASRLLAQASFGASRQSILQVQALGVEGWLNRQFTLQGAPHLDYVRIHSNGSHRAARHEIWWSDVVRGEDQLRQRVAFALSQLFVVSDTGYTLSNSQYGITAYYDLLRDHAFGNYRELLEQVTLSPVMGLYLSMLQNARSDPEASTRADENYAREVLQLFSIGLHVLNMDGSTDGSPVFTQEHIEAFARAFTGWNYADAGVWDRPPFTGADLISPMRPFESFHDTEAKTLLNGVVAPAGLTARQDLEIALDNIFYHPNVGPFISTQLIKRLVTSNPSPAYIARVATVFNDDGTGERGNLQAVIRAILLDSEARTVPPLAAYGKLREPVLRLSHLWRAFNVQPGLQSGARNEFNTVSPQLMNLEDVTGQAVLKSPSVFNFFQPSFSPAGPVAEQNLVAPEFELFTESNELATSNRIGRQIQLAYLGNPDGNARQFSYLDFTYERSLAGDTDSLLDHLNVVLMSGNMSNALRQILIDHLNELPDTEEGLSQRVRDAVTLIMASPDYLVQM